MLYDIIYLSIWSINNYNFIISTGFRYKKIDANLCEEYNFHDYDNFATATDACSKDSMCTAVRESSDWFSDFYKWSLCRRGYDFEDKGYHGKVFVKQGTANNLYVTLLLTSIRFRKCVGKY